MTPLWRFIFPQDSYKQRISIVACTVSIRTASCHAVVTNYSGNLQIKALHRQLSDIKGTSQRCRHQKQSIAGEALSIYHRISERKNHFVINTTLKFCFDAGKYDDALRIWEDIAYLHTSNHEDRHKILYYVLIKCITKSDLTTSDQCITILESINNCNYTLKLTAPFIKGLLSKCASNPSVLNFICSLIDEGVIVDINDPHCVISKTELISHYGRIGDMGSAEIVFNSIPRDALDAICCSAMMSCFNRNHHPEKALSVYRNFGQNMNDEILHSLAIKSCIDMNDTQHFEFGKSIHSDIPMKNDCITFKNSLIEFYGHFRDPSSAMNIFHSITTNQISSLSLNAIMRALIRNNKDAQTLLVYHQNQDKSDQISHVLALKAFKNTNDFDGGQSVIESLQKRKEHLSVETVTTWIDFYGHFGVVDRARNLFDGMKATQRGTVTVNAMLKCLLNNGCFEECIELYSSQKNVVDDISQVMVIRAFQNSGQFKNGKSLIQNEVNLQHLNNRSIELVNTVIDFYGDAKDIDVAMQIFHMISEHKRDVTSIGSMMNALIKNQKCSEALSLYEEYRNTKSDDILHGLAISACKHSGDLERGKQIIDSNMNYQSIELITTAIDFYGTFSDIKSAKRLFMDSPMDIRNTAVVNTMMSCLVKNEQFQESVTLYFENESLLNDTTHSLALKSTKMLKDWETGKRIIRGDREHIDLTRGRSTELLTSIIDFYGHCRDVESAQKIFDSIPNASMTIEPINAMMNVYCINELNSKCITLFQSIDTVYRMEPNLVSYSIAFKACAQCKLLSFGQYWHQKLAADETTKWMLRESSLQTVIMTMYGECGKLDVVDGIFEEIQQNEPVKYGTDITLWNCWMNAHGKNGDVSGMTRIYNAMVETIGLDPDYRTFVVLFSNLSHSRNVSKAIEIWEEMRGSAEKFRWHQFVVSALIDGMARDGTLLQAYELIIEYENRSDENMNDNEVMWMALLSGCIQHNDKTLAQMIYNDIFCLRFKHKLSYFSTATTLVSKWYKSLG